MLEQRAVPIEAVKAPSDLPKLLPVEVVTQAGGERSVVLSMMSLATLAPGLPQTRASIVTDFAESQMLEGLVKAGDEASIIAKSDTLFHALVEEGFLIPTTQRRDRYIVHSELAVRLTILMVGLDNDLDIHFDE